MTPDLVRLNRYRLEQDLSYRALAELVGVPYRTLHGLLTNPKLEPHDRTTFKIQRFLNSLPRSSARAEAR